MGCGWSSSVSCLCLLGCFFLHFSAGEDLCMEDSVPHIEMIAKRNLNLHGTSWFKQHVRHSSKQLSASKRQDGMFIKGDTMYGSWVWSGHPLMQTLGKKMRQKKVHGQPPTRCWRNIRTYLTICIYILYIYTKKCIVKKKKTCIYTILRVVFDRDINQVFYCTGSKRLFFKMEPWAWNIDIEENSQSCQCFRSRWEISKNRDRRHKEFDDETLSAQTWSFQLFQDLSQRFFFLQVLQEGFPDRNRLYKSGCEHLLAWALGWGWKQNCWKLFGIYAGLV